MKLLRLLLPVLLLGLSITSLADTGSEPLDSAQKQFFSQFRTAIFGEDVKQLMGLTHSLAKSCTNITDQERYYGLIMKGLVELLGHQQTIKEISSRKVDDQTLKTNTDTAAKNSMYWPITPERQIVVTYVKDNGKENSATILIARDQGQWKWVHLCYQK
jgi:hypothetical protein